MSLRIAERPSNLPDHGGCFATLAMTWSYNRNDMDALRHRLARRKFRNFRGANVRKLSRRLASRGILACSIPLALALSGCHLIDQTDIMKQPPAPAPAPPI